MQRSLIKLLWAVTFLWVIVACFRPLGFPDLWWQLDEGAQILTGRQLEVEVRTFAFAKTPVANEYLFFELLAVSLYQMAGDFGLWLGLGALTLAPFCILAWFIFRSTLRESPGIWAAFFLFFLLSYLRIQQRPELAANLCQIVLGLLLLRYPSGSLSPGRICLVAIIFTFWANLHGSFIIGLWMLVLFYGSKFLARREKIVLTDGVSVMAAACLGTVLNPDGIHRFLLPFQLYETFWARELTPEMASFPLIAALVAAPVVLASFLLLRPCQWRFLWLGLLLISAILLSLNSIRYINLMAVSFLLILLQHLILNPANAVPSFHSKMSYPLFLGGGLALIAVSLGLVLESFRFHGSKPYLDLDDIGAKALAKIESKAGGKPVFFLADPWVGSLASAPRSANLFPLVHSGMSRFQPDTLRYAYLLERDPRAFRNSLETLQADCLIVNNRNTQWALALSGNPAWNCQDAGVGYVVFGRGPVSVPLDAKDPVQALCLIHFLSPQEQARALAFLKDARIPVAALDFLMDWTERQTPETLQKILAHTNEASYPAPIRAILLGALGHFEEAAGELDKNDATSGGIASWLSQKQGLTASSSMEISSSDALSIYELEWFGKAGRLSEKNRQKFLEPVWWEKFTALLNENLGGKKAAISAE